MNMFRSTNAPQEGFTKANDSGSSITVALYDSSDESSTEFNFTPDSVSSNAKSTTVIEAATTCKSPTQARGEHSRKVTVIGNGYVGLPLAVLMKDQGHQVTGFDVNQKCVDSHNQGISTIDDVENHMLEGLEFTSNIADIGDSDVYVICVPTPVTDKKLPDLSIVNKVKQTLLQVARPGSLIVLESTVGVGDTRRTFSDMVERGYFVANSPERIDPARKFPALGDIPKVVGGVDEASTLRAVEFYSTIFTNVVPARNSDHSEATKLLENCYRAVNISFINEFANFCEASGLEVNDIVDCASTKPYGFSPFRSWIGVGGHCIPGKYIISALKSHRLFSKHYRAMCLTLAPCFLSSMTVDPHYLIECSANGEKDWPILSNVMHFMHERPAMLARERATQQKLSKVLVCGVSYKPNVSDIRDAPQATFCQTMQQAGVDVHFYDPMVQSFEGLQKINSLDQVDEYDAVYVMHKHQVNADQLEGLRGKAHVEFFC